VGKYLYKYTVEGYRDPKTGKPRQRVLKYHGRVDREGNVVVPPLVRVDSVQSSFPVGGLSLFCAVAKELKIVERTAAILDVPWDRAGQVLCLALNQIGTRRPLGEVSAWVRRSPLPRWFGLDVEQLDRDAFERALGALCRVESDGTKIDAGLVLQEEMTRAWRNGSREPAQFYYDVTRQVYHGTCSPYAEPGYFPGGTKKNVLGFGMVASRYNFHPVLCRAIPGSRNDTLTVQDVVNQLKAWDYDRLTLILDRGMISRENLEFIVDSGFEQVGIVPETNKEAWEFLVKWADVDLRRPEFVVERSEKRAAYVKSWGTQLLGRRMRVVLVDDAVRGAEESVERDVLVSRSDRMTDPVKLRDVRHELGYLAIPAPGRRGFKVDRKLAKEDRIGDGRFLMFSTDLSMTAEEIFKAYFQRDEIEKAFRTLKGELCLGPIRYRRREMIDAYTTVVYLAYLMWSMVQRRLREKLDGVTVSGALKLLDDVHLVRFRSGKTPHEWLTRLSTAQERIIKYVGAGRLLRSG
jgi:hypothetical protein